MPRRGASQAATALAVSTRLVGVKPFVLALALLAHRSDSGKKSGSSDQGATFSASRTFSEIHRQVGWPPVTLVRVAKKSRNGTGSLVTLKVPCRPVSIPL